MKIQATNKQRGEVGWGRGESNMSRLNGENSEKKYSRGKGGGEEEELELDNFILQVRSKTCLTSPC